ncbi:MAG TPA: cytochrome c oxidase subunit 3 [Steroidobacteraceae bacterium]|jgi:cytochrome c oxidase subunit 3
MSASAEAATRRANDSDSEVGLWVFLASEVMFFGLLFYGYTIMRLSHPQAFAQASAHTDVLLGSINCCLLFTSSLTMALAARGLRIGACRASLRLLAATWVLGFLFLAVKCYEYHEDIDHHLVPWGRFAFHGSLAAGERLFFFLYFVMTGAHAMHLIVGLGIIAVMLVGVARGKYTEDNCEAVELAALYWALVDTVWIFLYPILYLVHRP